MASRARAVTTTASRAVGARQDARVLGTAEEDPVAVVAGIAGHLLMLAAVAVGLAGTQRDPGLRRKPLAHRLAAGVAPAQRLVVLAGVGQPEDQDRRGGQETAHHDTPASNPKAAAAAAQGPPFPPVLRSPADG